MNSSSKMDFGSEMAKLMPVFLREVARSQESAFTKGDMAVSHIVVLEILKEKGSSTMSELAGAMNLTMSAVTGIIDKMIEGGLVKRERPKEDRRVVKVALLPKGLKFANQIYDWRRSVANDLFASLSEGERKEYLRLIKKVCESIIRKK